MKRNVIVVLNVEDGQLCMEGYSGKKPLSEKEGYEYKKLRATGDIWEQHGRVHVKLPINTFEKKLIPLDELTDCSKFNDVL